MSYELDNEFPMDMDDEEYEEDEQISESIEDNTTLDSLDGIVIKIADFVTKSNIDTLKLKMLLFETHLERLASERGINHEHLVISSSQDDKGYNALIVELYPTLKSKLAQAINEKNRPLLIQLLNQALQELVASTTKSEEVKEEEPKKEEPSPDFAEDDEPDPELEANTMRVMNVYKDLFEVGFELQVPFGILTKDGYLRLRKEKTYFRETSSLRNLYELINDITYNFLKQSEIGPETDAKDLRDIQMRKGITYYPEFQLGNLFGVLGSTKVDSWQELSKNIQPEIRRNIKANLDAGRDIAQIVDALTTCIVISEFDAKSAIRLRINVGNNLAGRQAFEKEYAIRKSSIMAGIGELYHCEVTKSGVLEVIIVFNQAAFNGKPLFAYEAVKNLMSRGRKPSLKSMILGQNTSGKILTTNLDSQQACIILVGAGQRSGKGVLTLNLLGTILAEGSPLIYMDGKPDMAPVLWNIGKKYGVNPAAWDLFEHNGNRIGNGAPERMLVENPGIFGVLMYLKMLQLMMVSASLQAKDIKLLDGKRPFFIFDEAYAVQMTMAASWQKVVDTAKDKNADPEEKEWCVRVVKWAESLDADLPAIINSQLPKSGVSTVWLFQSMQPSSWNPYAVAGLGSNKLNIMKKPIESRLSIKFLGRGTSDSEYALGSVKVKENKLISNRVLSDGGRHFAMSGSQKITDMDSVTVFKPYLVLNESQNGTKAAEELKGNLSPDVLAVVAPEGELHPGAGFEGFAQMLGEGAIQNLGQGRAYIEAVLSSIGLMHNYSTIDEYLYDTSVDSFKTLGALVKGAEVELSQEEDGYTYEAESLDIENTHKPTQTQTNLQPQVVNVTENNGVPVFTVPDMDNFYSPDEYNTVEPTGNLGNQDNEDNYDGIPEDDYEQQQTQQTRSERYTPSQNDILTNPVNQEQTVENTPYIPPSKRMNYDGAYTEPMFLPTNPFRTYGRSDKPISALNAINMMSDFIMKEILKIVGDYSRIQSFEATNTGLVVNNHAFRPQLEEDIIESMPFDIQHQVRQGNLTELFHFGNLSKFRNLVVLRVDNSRLAEGRVRREIGLSPRKDWYKLFDRFRNLQELYIGGTKITDEETSQAYENDGRGGFSLTEKLREKFQMPTSILSSSLMERVWDSRPVRVFGGALGWTAGIKVFTMAAAFMGPWALIAGAFAGYGAYREIKNRNQKRK